MRYLITSALPYANAPLHIGHVLEIVQTDVWVRSLKLAGNEVFYYCASDTHGTPIMLKAQELNTTPEELSKKYKKLHSDTYKSYNVDLNNFHTTHSKENKELTEHFFNSAYEKVIFIQKKLSSYSMNKKISSYLIDLLKVNVHLAEQKINMVMPAKFVEKPMMLLILKILTLLFLIQNL